jgi:hypothetical protein
MKTFLISTLSFITGLGVCYVVCSFRPYHPNDELGSVTNGFKLFTELNNFPYSANPNTLITFSSNVKTVTLGMSYSEVEAILGKPDVKTIYPYFENNNPTTLWLYYFKVNSKNIVTSNDSYIQVSFDKIGQLDEIIPINTPSVSAIGNIL